MYLLRDLHPTLLSALEGIVDQLVWFRENWYEELLRQLNEGLIVCQAAAFENRTDGNEGFGKVYYSAFVIVFVLEKLT